MPTALGKFDGREVIKTSVAITNTGDGLSKALGVDPTVLHHRDKVWVVLECEVKRVGFEEIADTSKLVRVHTLKAGAATLVDEVLVREHLDEQQRRIEEAEGIQRLPMGEDGDEPDADGE